MKRKIIWWGLLVLILVAAVYGYREYMRKRPDSKSLEAKFNVTATSILAEFEGNEPAATKKYNGREIIIAVTGWVKEIKKDEKGFYTLMLGDSSSLSSVQCAMDTLYAAELSDCKQGETITIKGSFTGYNSDETGLLGSDVKLNMCVWAHEKKP